jgi:hypothetical protein
VHSLAASRKCECAWNRECNRQCYGGEFHDCLLFPEIGDISFITIKFFFSATEAAKPLAFRRPQTLRQSDSIVAQSRGTFLSRKSVRISVPCLPSCLRNIASLAGEANSILGATLTAGKSKLSDSQTRSSCTRACEGAELPDISAAAKVAEHVNDKIDEMTNRQF